MRISGEGKIGIALALVGLAGAGAIMIAPAHVEIGWGLIAIAVIGGILLAKHHFLGKRMNWVLPWVLIIGGPSIGGVLLYLNREKELPGFTSYAVVRLYDSPEFIRRHLFDVASDEKAKITFYLSASGFFTLSVIDIRGEPYTLEAKAGRDGIPIDDFIVLFCEVGVSDKATIMRIVVNDKEVARREILLPLNLGKMDWKPISVGTLRTKGAPPPDPNGRTAAFLLMELAFYSKMIRETDQHKLLEYARQKHKLPFD